MDLNPPYDQLVPELKLPEYAGLDDGAALAHLRGKTETFPWGVPWAALALWAARDGARSRMEDAATGALTSAPVPNLRSIALSFLDNIRGSVGTSMLDLTNPAVTGATVGGVYQPGMLDALTAAGVLTADPDQKAELMALGTVTRPPPWAVGLGAGHVASARDLIARGA